MSSILPQHRTDDLNYFLGAIGTMFQEIENLARNADNGDPGWSVLMDVHRIPEKGLDWLAQFVGVTLDHDEPLRQQVRAHDRWGRGTTLSMVGPAARWLPEDARMYMSERNPTPYEIIFVFVVPVSTNTQSYEDIFELYDSYFHLKTDFDTYSTIYDGLRGDLNVVKNIISANKPAGIQIHYITTDTTLYMALYLLYSQYQGIYNDYNTYQEVFSAPFPNINLTVPKPQQLISARYYRNLYNQFETYQHIIDAYLMY